METTDNRFIFKSPEEPLHVQTDLFSFFIFSQEFNSAFDWQKQIILKIQRNTGISSPGITNNMFLVQISPLGADGVSNRYNETSQDYNPGIHKKIGIRVLPEIRGNFKTHLLLGDSTSFIYTNLT
jgi:hypothetical protein